MIHTTFALMILASTIQVPLPPVTTALLVELDGYDVTEVVQVSKDGLTLSAQSLALDPGTHRLRVLAVHDNGDLDPVLEQDIVIEGAASGASKPSWGLLVGSAWRTMGEPEADFVGKSRAEHRATLTWSAERQASQWMMRGSASALYDNVTLTSDDHVWNSPEYSLEVGREMGSGRVTLGAGDDTIAYENLLFSSYSRRGLRFDAKTAGERAQIHAFTLNSEPLTRLNADILPTSDIDTVQGGYASVSPVGRHPEWLRITTGFLSGNTTLDGVATSTVDSGTRYGGQAYNGALDSWIAGGGLWLHAEFARSSFDSDGLASGDGAQKGDAAHYAARWSSDGGVALPGLDQWAAGIESQRVGAHFFSLGNLALPGDLALRRGYVTVLGHGAQFTADETRYRSNVDDDALRATRRGHTRAFTTSYTPLQLDPTHGIWRVIGTPTFSAEWHDITWRQRPEDAAVVGFDVNTHSRAHAFGIDFSHDTFSLSLRRDDTRFDDDARAILVDDFEIFTPTPDTREHTYSLQLGWTPSRRFTLSPQVQTTRSREVGGGLRNRNILWGLQTQAVLRPERLWLQAGFSETHDRTDVPDLDDLPGSTQSLAYGGGTLGLTYRTYGAGKQLPVVDLRLIGRYARGFTHDTWQAALGVSMSWQREAQ